MVYPWWKHARGQSRRGGRYGGGPSAADYQEMRRRRLQELRDEGFPAAPIEIPPRAPIARSALARAWVDQIELYSDRPRRLPRGRTMLRRGAVLHHDVDAGQITALVSGKRLYTIEVELDPLPAERLERLRKRCAVEALFALDGEPSEALLARLHDGEDGLFPRRDELEFRCDCPDPVRMCKHIAAALYGLALKLDKRPELLFILRGIDPTRQDPGEAALALIERGAAASTLPADADLSALFGVTIENPPEPIQPIEPSPTESEEAAAPSSSKPEEEPESATPGDLLLHVANALRRRAAEPGSRADSPTKVANDLRDLVDALPKGVAPAERRFLELTAELVAALVSPADGGESQPPSPPTPPIYRP